MILVLIILIAVLCLRALLDLLVDTHLLAALAYLASLPQFATLARPVLLNVLARLALFINIVFLASRPFSCILAFGNMCVPESLFDSVCHRAPSYIRVQNKYVKQHVLCTNIE